MAATVRDNRLSAFFILFPLPHARCYPGLGVRRANLPPCILDRQEPLRHLPQVLVAMEMRLAALVANVQVWHSDDKIVLSAPRVADPIRQRPRSIRERAARCRLPQPACGSRTCVPDAACARFAARRRPRAARLLDFGTA